MCSVRESELRQLRRQNTEYEEQNAILSKHVDNMKQAIEKLEVEATQHRNNNSALQQHLNLLRTTLVANFSRIPLPGCLNCQQTYRILTLQCYGAVVETERREGHPD